MQLVERGSRVVKDARIWSLTAVFVGWYLASHLVAHPALDVLFVPISALMFVYYVSLAQVTLVLGSLVGFWGGFCLFCWLVAFALVSTRDWIDARLDVGPGTG